MKKSVISLVCLSGLTLAGELPATGAVPKGLASSDWSSIRAAYEAGRHEVHRQENGTLSARNPGQQWRTEFDGKGFTVTPDQGGWTWGLELTGYGERTLLSAFSSLTHEGGKVISQRDENLTEWFINDTRGLEQGWTIQTRPKRADDSSRLQLHLKLRGDLQAQVSPDSSSVSFQTASGSTALAYGGLKAWDADGKHLNVRFGHVDQKDFRISLADQNARYPITIDPIAQQAYLKASNTGANDRFGYSVAISGDTVVVGAVTEDSNATTVNGSQADNSSLNSGAAYVFIRTGSIWTQQAYLKASNTDPSYDLFGGDLFGYSVAIAGDTIIVGAPNEDSSATGVNGNQGNNSMSDAGASYVFTRNGNTWTQQAYIKASDTRGGEMFGSAVAISGETIIIGAPRENSSATGINGDQFDNNAPAAGAAYVFIRNGSIWTQQAYLKSSNAEREDFFGEIVAISSDTVVVGANGEDSNATGVNGNQSDNTASSSGASYVFKRTGTFWAQQAYLKASNTSTNDKFGDSVNISGDTVVVGAPEEESNTTGVNGNQTNNSVPGAGATYIFSRNGTSWTQQAYLKASDTGLYHRFGYSVAIAGARVFVGAIQATSGRSGAAYVFAQNGSVWGQEAYLKASNFEETDYFGISIAASNDTLLVGADAEDSSATGVNGDQSNNSASAAGAAYIFNLNAVAAPEMTISQSGNSLVSGGTKSFGVVPLATVADLSFALLNTGDADLTLTGTPKVSISGSGDFAVTSQPTSPISGPSGSTNFSVRFSPTTAGPKTATLSIANNDSDENPFEIVLTGATPIIPTVTSPASTSATGTSATLGGNVTSDGGAPVFSRGVVFTSTLINSDPLIGGIGVTNTLGTGITGAFTVNVASLTPGISYSYKAYATNSVGTGYTTTGTFSTLSNNADLTNLVINTGTLSPVFSSGTTGYTALVPNATTGIAVTPTRSQANATITVNGTAVASGAASGNIPLNLGSNTVTIVVTAQNGVSTQSYTVAVTRAGLSPTITSPTSVAVGSLSATLGGNVTSDGGALISSRGVVLSPTGTNSNPLIGGSGVINVTASGTTGIFTLSANSLTPATAYSYKAYAVNNGGTGYSTTGTFTTPSNNAALSNLVLTTATLSPTFASGTTAYTASVPNATASLTVTPTRVQANATIRVNATIVNSGTASGSISLIVGNNPINIAVTAQDGVTTQTYTVTVTRAATLPTVTTPTFATVSNSSATLGGNVTADGGAAITERGVVFSPTATDSNPTIGGLGVTKSTGSGTTGIFTTSSSGLSPATAYTFKAYATNSVGTGYTSTGTFTTLSNNAALSNLVLTTATFSPTFASGTTAYTASVPNATASLTVTPTRVQANATIRVNGITVNSGSASGSIPLGVGSNPINIVVTAQDGVTTETYTVTVTRAATSPTVTTPTSSVINAISAALGGNVTSDGGSSITSRGVVISLTSANSNPEIGGVGVTVIPVSGTTGSLVAFANNLTTSISYSFKAYAINGIGSSYSAVGTFTIPPPKPVITSPLAFSGRQGDVFSYQITATQSPTSYTTTTLPSGLALNVTTGQISGTPSQNGTFALTLGAANSGGTGNAALSLVIAPPIPPPVILSPAFAAGNVNVVLSIQATATNSPTAYSLLSAPPWLAVNAAGLLTGTPTSAGNFAFKLRGSNGSGPGAYKDISLQIEPNTQAPSITSLVEKRGRKGVIFDFALAASVPATSFTLVSGSLPAGITFSSSSGVFSGTPTVAGTFNLVLTATNSFGPGKASPLRIVIDPPLQVPAITSAASFNLSVGASFSTVVVGSNSPTSFTFANLPGWLVQTGTSGQLTGTPPTPGVFNVSVFATNADGPGNAQALVINVAHNPNAPKIQLASGFIAYQGLPFSATLQTSPASTSITASGLPAGVTLNSVASSLGGTPQTAGSYSGTLQASNANGLGPVTTANFTVLPPPGTPEIISSLTEYGKALEPYSYSIQARSEIPVTSYSAGGLPTGLSLNASTGAISGTPKEIGIFQVLLAASSAAGQGTPATLALTIRPGSTVPKITSLASASELVERPFSYQIVATNGPISAYAATNLPEGLALNAVTGLITGKIVNSGTFDVVLTAANLNGTGPPQTLKIAATAAAGAPIVLIPNVLFFYGSQPLLYEVQTEGMPSRPWPAGTGVYAEGLPKGMSLNFATGILSGVPTLVKDWTDFTLKIYASNNGIRGISKPMTLRFYRAPGSRPIITGPKQLTARSGQNLSFNITADRAGDWWQFGILDNGYNDYLDQSSAAFNVAASRLGIPGFSTYYVGGLKAYQGWGFLSGLPLRIDPAIGAPGITSSEFFIARVGTAVSGTLTASGSPFEFAADFAGNAPSGITLNAATGQFAGTPSVPGSYSFLARAKNAQGWSLPKFTTLAVLPAGPAVAALTSNNVTIRGFSLRAPRSPSVHRVGQPFSYMPPISAGANFYIFGSLPDGLVGNISTGSISGIPEKPGQFSVSIRPFSDDSVGEEMKIPFTILPITGAPEMSTNITINGTAGTELIHTIAATPAPVGFNIAETPDFVLVDPLTGAVSGTPNTPGTYTFQASAFSAIGEGMPVTVTLQIAPAAGTPVVTLQQPLPTMQVGVPFTATLTSAPAATFYDGGSLPYGINLDPQTGVISGTPLVPGRFEVPLWGVNSNGQGGSLNLVFDIAGATGTPLITNPGIVRVVGGNGFSLQLASSPAAASYSLTPVPPGLAFDPATGLLSGTLSGNATVRAYGSNALGEGTSKEIQIKSFAASFALWIDEEFGEQADNPAISGWNVDPDKDGVENLLEFAFNMPSLTASPSVMTPTSGISGLPFIGLTGSGSGTMLRVEYIRRKNSGLVYTPKRSSTLQTGSFTAMTAIETVTLIDDTWERVVVQESADPVTSPKSFAIIEVTLP